MSTLLQYLDEVEQQVSQWPEWKRESIRAAFQIPKINNQQSTPINKRVQFPKDLDKLISGDYVLVPKEPTREMERAAMEAGAGFLFAQIWTAALNSSQNIRPASEVAACMKVVGHEN